MNNIRQHFQSLKFSDIQSRLLKNECLFSCDSPYSPDGLFLCIKTLKSVTKKYLLNYSQTFNSYCFLNYKYRRFIEKNDTQVTRLALNVEGGFSSDNLVVKEEWSIFLLPEEISIKLPDVQSNSDSNIKSIMTVDGIDEETAKKISEIQKSESTILSTDANLCFDLEAESLKESKFAENLEQINNGIKIPPKGWKCSKCDMTENLWLNLTDGTILCGRKFWDGSGGNNHAVEYYEEKKYPLAVKLGTITPTKAEVYSYAEDNMVIDPKLDQHLKHWGINRMLMEKTDKTLTEMEIKMNDRFGDWLLLQETKSAQQPRHGPGLTGLYNLGNSCYMNSVVQCLFAIDSFRQNYAYTYDFYLQNILSSSGDLDREVLNNFKFQFTKIGHALCSGEYSFLGYSQEDIEKGENGTLVPEMPGLKPLILRSLVGKNHPEFSTKCLQDANEYFGHILGFIEKDSCDTKKVQTVDDEGVKIEAESALKSLMVSVQNRIECGSTKKVRYVTSRDYSITLPISLDDISNKGDLEEYAKIENQQGIKPEEVIKPRVLFTDCLKRWFAEDIIPDWISPATNPPKQKTFARKSQRITNFPNYLWFVASRFTIGEDWTPKKLDVEIILTDKKPKKGASETVEEINNYVLDLSNLKVPNGFQPGEEPMPEDNDSSDQPVEYDPVTLSSIVEMGFSQEAGKRAIKFTNNQGVESAMAWIMEHMEDPDLNDPMPSSEPKTLIDEGNVALLTSMGIERNLAITALRRFPNQLDVATDWAFNNPDAIMEPEEPVNNKIEESNNSNNIPLSDGIGKYKLIAMISHIGKTTSHGHYVCHIKRSALNSKGIPNLIGGEKKKRLTDNSSSPDEWIIFNDEKVQCSTQPPFGYAYMYLWKRIE